jgi:hypothetical protein
LAIREVALQVLPPLAEVKERMAVPLAEYATTTVPLGWTRGWPPSPLGVPEGVRRVMCGT